MDERIDIEVIDKVAKTIKPELLGISAAAKNAYTQIAKLKREMGVTGGAGIGASMKAVATAERDATRASSERARQARATASALDTERIATDRLRAAAARASVSAVRQGSGANLGVASGSRSDMAAQTAIMRQTSVAQKEVAATAKDAAAAQAGFANNTAKVGQNAGLARHHLLNLGFQLQDIFVSLASGQKPLTVFIQQGGQIGQIAAQSGVGMGGMAKAAAGIAMRFAPLALVIGAAASGMYLFKRSLNIDPEVKKIINDLGLTAKEIKKLENTTVSTGDIIKATFQEIASNVGISLSGVKSYFSSAMDFIAMLAKGTLAGIYASFVGTFNGIKELVKQGFKGEITSLTDVSKVLVGESVKAFNVADKALSRFGANVRKRALDNKRVDLTKQANEIIAGRGPGRKKGKSDAERLAERQAEALRKLTGELEREQAVLAQHLVGIDATIADRMNSIADSLASVKIDLRAKEYDDLRKSLTGTVTEIERLKNVNSQLAQIYSQSVEPVDRWVDANDAAAIAIERFADDADKVALINRWLKQQEEAYLDATNPMRQYSKALLDQRELYAFFGRELEVQTEIQRRYNEMKALDPSLNPDKAAIGKDVRSDMKREGVQGFLGDVDRAANDNFREGGNQWIIDNYKTLYAEIDAMRKGDIASEQEAARNKAELDKRYMDARLQNTQSVLGNLSQLQNSHVKEVAAIGKAAAVAQATIDGVRAVQAALAGPPGPPWSYAIAATTGVAAAANVARIMGVGFQKGGYTGDVPAHQVAGQVHGREYVMDAAATARIGVPTLEAMRNGRLNPGPAANNNAPRVTVINNAGASVQVRERSDGELEIMVEQALDRKMGPTFERRLANPNSRESRAIGSNFTTRRNRS